MGKKIFTQLYRSPTVAVPCFAHYTDVSMDGSLHSRGREVAAKLYNQGCLLAGGTEKREEKFTTALAVKKKNPDQLLAVEEQDGRIVDLWGKHQELNQWLSKLCVNVYVQFLK